MSDSESPNKFQPSQGFLIPPENFKPHKPEEASRECCDGKGGAQSGACCPGSRCCAWFSKQSLKKKIGISITAVVLVGAIVCGVRFACIEYHFKKADAHMKNGFFALAEEQLDCYRRSYVKEERGCNALISVYHQTQNKARRQWASESCIQNGVQTLTAYLGISAGLQENGRIDEALRVLKELKPRFDQNPAYHFEIYGIYRRTKMNKEAANELYRVYELAQDKKSVAGELLPLLQSIGDTARFEKVKAESGGK